MIDLPDLRRPESSDGAAVWELIRDCHPLDRNSLYCNLLQCDHFSETCVLAEREGEVLGWISAYIVPDKPDTLFVWQVAVSEAARGMGLAGKMLDEILDRDVCADVDRMQTTITRGNAASWALFRRFADRRDAPLESNAHFTRDEHFEGRHDTEHMVEIGPFGALADAKAAA
ncbi:MAG: diaminobutyrate acetyltransferase [Pseudomonadota bacterium]|nr:diaminobutyrate acetyltransferase [Pseudomonadota bacterium]